MIYFILFGLCIGLFVYILTVIVDIRTFARDLGAAIIQKMPVRQDKNISSDAKKVSSDIHENLDLLRKDLIRKNKGIGLQLYIRKTNESWQEATIGKNSELAFSNVQPGLLEMLNQAVHKKYTQNTNTVTNSFVYDAFFRIDYKDPANSSGKMLLRVFINRNIIIEKFHADKDLLIGYAVILIIFSIILGSFFAKKITRPLNELSDAAYKIAKGDYTYRNEICGKDEIGFLGKTLNYMSEKIYTHINEISYREKTMEAMNQIDKTVMTSLFDPKVIDMVAEIVASFLHTGQVILVLPDETVKSFILSVYRADQADSMVVHTGPVPFEKIPPDQDIHTKEYCEFILKKGGPFLPEWLSRFITLDKGTVIHAPLFSSGNYQGSCIIIEKKIEGFSSNENEAIRMLADQVGVALQNARIYREKEELLLDLLLALTRAIDAKSKWTGGHSERVAKYALSLAAALNMPEEERETIKISSMLHDIGKIATPESILDKPGKLTMEEYAIVKQHPVEGSHIIGNIKSYEKIVPGILYHHEHWDGSEYPEGLKGLDIPKISRVITVADVYDAITAERPYRGSMGHETAIEFMKENSAKLFDPEIVEAFLKIAADK